MASVAQDGSNGILPVAPSPESMSSLNKLVISAGDVSTDTQTVNEQQSSAQDVEVIPGDTTQDTRSKESSGDIVGEKLLPGGGALCSTNPPQIYVPQAQPLYYGGYSNTSTEWDDYPQYLKPDFLELGSPGIYSENPSYMLPTGYSYNVQVPFGPYSPMTPPPAYIRGDGQPYSALQYPFTGPYFQQSVPPSLSFVNSPGGVSQADPSAPIVVDQQTAFHPETSNPSGMLLGQRANYPSCVPFNRSSFSGNSGIPAFFDSHQGYDGFGSGGIWSDWSKSLDGQGSLHPLSPISLTSRQQRPLYNYGSSMHSYDRGYNHDGMYHPGTSYSNGFAMNNCSWIRSDKGRRQGKDGSYLCSCNGTLDILCEQNRGPRSTRPKNVVSEDNSLIDRKHSLASTVDQKVYNNLDFVTEYDDAKFFVIKSYSEDNIHKSIKYGIWTSTPNGNRKLDASYREAKAKQNGCPVFLFFSVNASAQFCGVAEMVGPVDFDNNADYWQQDKWSGQFPVKWHIVKDVPNSLLRQIILENNDNKPVTNSRDTQEVKLEQGLEMLKIFKKHESDLSILDDFNFYEERQKVMQEQKAWRQQQQPNSTILFPANTGVEKRSAPFTVNLVNQLAKSFAQVVRLGDGSKESAAAAENVSSGPGELVNPATSAGTQSS